MIKINNLWKKHGFSLLEIDWSIGEIHYCEDYYDGFYTTGNDLYIYITLINFEIILCIKRKDKKNGNSTLYFDKSAALIARMAAGMLSDKLYYAKNVSENDIENNSLKEDK